MMTYTVRAQTLIVTGDFDGLSTGINGGRRRVRAVLNHQVGFDFNEPDARAYIARVVAGFEVAGPYFAFLTAVYMENLCVIEDARLTAFVTAGISNPVHDPSQPGTINIILAIGGRMSEGALANAIITATEAKTRALFDSGYDFTGTTTDAVVVLGVPPGPDDGAVPFYEYGGPLTEIGQSIYRCVKKGVREGIKRQHHLGGEVNAGRRFAWRDGAAGGEWRELPRAFDGDGSQARG